MMQAGRTLPAGTVLAALLFCATSAAEAQVFISTKPRPDFSIGPLFIVATVQPDLSTVAVRVSWSVTLPPGRPVRTVGPTLYLLWPNEMAEATAPGTADPALRRHVEERGFTVVGGGRLLLESRDRTKLGTGAPGSRLEETASFVTFYKSGMNPGLSGIGTFIEIPWTAATADAVSLVSLPMTVKDMITAKPATWLEELFWGRRNVVSLGAGSAGSLALYSLYFDQRDRVVPLGRDFSTLIVSFVDSDHLRIEDINPTSATRRPSRVRASGETISLPIGASEGSVPQALKVQFSYFSGPIAMRPIVVSVILLIVGNLMGTMMFGEWVGRMVRTRFHLEPAGGRRPCVPPPDVLRRLVPGTTTQDEVLALCGPPTEQQERVRSPVARTLVYRGVERVPHRRFRLGRLATVSRWDEEQHEVLIGLENDRVTEVETRLRRL